MSVTEFELPEGALGRFAIVKLWPEIKAAEDENIARLKLTASSLGLKCFEITPEGEILGSGGLYVSKENCDFVIHLHFETPKIYDVFSFVALWNPLKFYHEWGYERFSRHLLTHDDFLSCSSTWADDHVNRMISGDYCHLSPTFNLYHSLSEPIHPPGKDKFSIFYAGINWERLGKGKSRHQELLDLLDKSGRLKIYGPKVFQGVEVWAGYQSYQKEIPFDGVSMINEIAKCGAALVLSSEAHKQSGLMSNRLFESLAAGALVICDENPFAKRHFGDSLLYLDTRESLSTQFDKIVGYLDWANDNPQAAKTLAQKAQGIFLEKFALNRSLINIYNGLAARKAQLADRILPNRTEQPLIRLFVLLNQFSGKVLDDYINSIEKQIYKNFKVTFVIDVSVSEKWIDDLNSKLSNVSFEFEYLVASYSKRISDSVNEIIPLGNVLNECLNALGDESGFIFLAPNESMHSDHLSILAGSMIRNPDKSICATSVLLRHSDGKKVFHDYYNGVTFSGYSDNKPMGFGRFLINSSKVREDISSALPYLTKLVFGVFVGRDDIQVESRSTIIIDIQNEFPKGGFDAAHELPIIADYSPWCIKKSEADTSPSVFVPDVEKLAPNSLTLKNLTKENKVKIFASLLAAALPGFIVKPLFWVHDRLK